jgi:hypothetical protein
VPNFKELGFKVGPSLFWLDPSVYMQHSYGGKGHDGQRIAMILIPITNAMGRMAQLEDFPNSTENNFF